MPHGVTPLPDKIEREITERLEALDPELAPAAHEDGSVSTDDVERERQDLRADLEVLEWHLKPYQRVRGAEEGRERGFCATCKVQHWCPPIVGLGEKYNVLHTN